MLKWNKGIVREKKSDFKVVNGLWTPRLDKKIYMMRYNVMIWAYKITSSNLGPDNQQAEFNRVSSCRRLRHLESSFLNDQWQIPRFRTSWTTRPISSLPLWTRIFWRQALLCGMKIYLIMSLHLHRGIIQVDLSPNCWET